MDATEVAKLVWSHALCLPESWEDHPWGETAIKVRKKVFLFSSLAEDHFSMTVKLPASGAEALALPGASPTGYGLGKSGWVSIRIGAESAVDPDLLLAWLEESYRAVAPKRLAARL